MSDGAVSDGGMSDSGAASAKDAGGGPTPCTGSHALCDDFERGNPAFVSPLWGADEGVAFHTIGTELGATSGTRALVIGQNDGGTDFYYLKKSFTGPLQSIHCSFSYFVKAAPGAYASVFRAELTGASGDYAMTLDLRPGNDSLPAFVEQGPQPNLAYVPIGPGVWNKIEFELPKLRMWANGVVVPITTDAGIPPAGPFSVGTVHFGLETNTDNPGWRAAVDDVVCDTK